MIVFTTGAAVIAEESKYACVDSTGGAFTVANGSIFFALLILPFLFYFCCVGGYKALTKQSSITQNDQNGAFVLPCCNCLLSVILVFGMFAYLVFAVITLITLFNCTDDVISVVMGVFVVLALPINLVLGIGANIFVCAMLPDSCDLCCQLCANYHDS